jgi:hypothetical protein
MTRASPDKIIPLVLTITELLLNQYAPHHHEQPKIRRALYLLREIKEELAVDEPTTQTGPTEAPAPETDVLASAVQPLPPRP